MKKEVLGGHVLTGDSDSGRSGIRPVLSVNLASTNGAIVLNWTAVPGSPANYSVYKRVNGGGWGLLITIGALTTTDANLMVANDINEYRVRANFASGSSPFSRVIGVGFNILKNATADVSLFYGTLVLVIGTFRFQNCASLVSISAPALQKTNEFTFSNCPVSTLFSFPALTTADVMTVTVASPPTIVFPAMTAHPNTMNISTCNGTTLVSFPALATCNGFLISGMADMTAINFPVLTSTNGQTSVNNNPKLTTISFPVLTSVNTEFDVAGNATLVSLSCPVLTDILGGDFDNTNNPLLTSESFPLLTSVGGSWYGSGNSSLATLDLPQFQSLGGDFGWSNTGLVTVNVPMILFPDGWNVQFNGGHLNEASVNHILSKLVASGVSTDSIDLSGGTNSPPTGQGLIDKATLIANGNIVTTN